jgi:septum formation protein
VSAAAPVVLASQSPRRRELLDRLGIAHVVAPADVDETPHPAEQAVPYTRRLALDKARAVAARLAGDAPAPIVIAADTTVVVDGAILGKPADAAEAAAMLRRLSGRAHVVATAVAVVRGVAEAAAVDEVAVHVRHLSDDEIAAYVATGEPMDKAGAYGIQGLGAALVPRIDGDYYAVMGLGLVTMLRLVEEVGGRYEMGRGILITGG